MPDSLPLEHQNCEPCKGKGGALDAVSIKNLKTQIPDWQVSSEQRVITRVFSFKNFFRTMSFVNAVAHIANIEGHHPDLAISYNKAKVTFTTHALGGLTQNDFICAKKVDCLI